jgi:hypothetical protein
MGQMTDKKDSVSKLERVLTDKKDMIRSVAKNRVYGIIDKVMKKISKKNDISPKELHDRWFEKHGIIPDKWVMKEQRKVEKKGTLNVFDIDDTLFKTDSHVLIVKDGKVVKELDSGEFNTYKLKPGEKYDFQQFRSGKHFYSTAKPIDNMIKRAQRAVASEGDSDKSIIITARSDFVDKEPFLQKFREHGFPIDKVYVERAGNLQKIMPSAKTHITKGVVLLKYIKTGKYNKIRMWDDHEGNLNILLKIGQKYPEISIEAYLVDELGNTKRYTR